MKFHLIHAFTFLTCLLFITINCFSENYTPDNVVAYWRFEDGNPGSILKQPSKAYNYTPVVYDESGNGNHLSTWNNTNSQFKYVANTYKSKVPQSSQLNNTAIKNQGNTPKLFTKSSASKPTSTNIETADFSKFTIEASYKPVLNNTSRTIISRDAQISPTNQRSSFNLQVTKDNRFKVLFIDQLGNTHVAQTKANFVTSSNWYHLVATSNGSKLELFLFNDNTNPNTPNDQAKYISIASKTYSSKNSNIFVGSKTSNKRWHSGGWSIGRGLSKGKHADYALGLIDEVRISNTVLPQSQWLQSKDTAFTNTSWINPRLASPQHNQAITPQRSIVKLGNKYYGAKEIGPANPAHINTRLQLLQSNDAETWATFLTIDFLPTDSKFHDVALWAGTLPNETKPCLLVAHAIHQFTDPDNNPHTHNNLSYFTLNLIRVDNLDTKPTYHRFKTNIDAGNKNKFVGAPFFHQLSNNTLQIYYDHEVDDLSSNDQYIVMKTLNIQGKNFSTSSNRTIAVRAPIGQLSRDGMPTVTTLRKDPLNQGNDTLLLVFESINEYTFKRRINDTTHKNQIAHNNVVRGIIGYNGGKTNNDWNNNWNVDKRFIVYQPKNSDALGRPYNAYNPHVTRLGNNAGPAVVAFLTDEAYNSHDWPADFSFQFPDKRRGQLKFTYTTDDFKTWSTPSAIHHGNTRDGTSTAYFTSILRKEDGKLITTIDLFDSHRVFTFTK
ncbi:hypothetical protein JD969_14240 [Planctomycetota bacterium]|nr:hypothetical protein JD969_14240 [Planctomycetota bacterium]